jgi:hypothetical protein
MCRECDTQCVSVGKFNLILRNLFSMITEWSLTFLHKLSRINVLLGNIHHVVFTSVEVFVGRQAVELSASSL